MTGLSAAEHVQPCYDVLLALVNETEEVNGQLSADPSLFSLVNAAAG